MINIDSIIAKAKQIVDAHKIAPGKYTRFIITPKQMKNAPNSMPMAVQMRQISSIP